MCSSPFELVPANVLWNQKQIRCCFGIRKLYRIPTHSFPLRLGPNISQSLFSNPSHKAPISLTSKHFSFYREPLDCLLILSQLVTALSQLVTQDDQLANSKTEVPPDPHFKSIFDSIIFLNLRFEFHFCIKNSSLPSFQSHFIIEIFQNSKIK